MRYNSFEEFFRAATGSEPYPYQRRIATVGVRLPDVIDVPPGLGKTAAIVLGWLWRVLTAGDDSVPRRLVIALPMRTLTRQTVNVIPGWIASLDLEDLVGVTELVGGMSAEGHSWRQRPGQFQILVATVDMSISRMLMRGYGLSRGVYPIDAGLLWNDTHLVVDETQLAPASTVTARQIAAFQTQYGSVATGLTCMTATLDTALLDTVDNPFDENTIVVRIGDDDLTPAVTQRLNAKRVVRQLLTATDNPRILAQAVAERHRYGLTLVIVNTVDTAVSIYKLLTARNSPLLDTPVLVLHSKFRPADRDRQFDELSRLDNVVVVSTQVVEAGVDLDARTLITEVAPWASVIQRSGRCNRAGVRDDAELWWFPSGKKSPYDRSDLESSADALRSLEGEPVTNAQLLNMGSEVKTSAPRLQTLRRSDFLALFDTSPDLSGNDLDISPYIRDTDDLDVSLAWVDFGGEKSPPDDLVIPGFEERCRAHISDVKNLLKVLQRRNENLWYFDVAQPYWGGPKWLSLRAGPPVRPGQVFVINAVAGGYTPALGLAPDSTAAVASAVSSDSAEAEPEGGQRPASDGNTSDSGAWCTDR
ncbi:hypothetical protein GCM10027169_15940 [Gordonia jinhuaensis]|uniref:Helicase C-terminal domain-containing protein n=1 Tax=Gordonia jinhuaensis TaxID=1517702 RepID=A0A916TK12_9ACTN|nr:CRISPR-associated helicase Cas3' [Gordonia jinhuaensis]GGB48820.1 hypothetical protein GCM10011489_39860 [Gordonia jinhuaensis]